MQILDKNSFKSFKTLVRMTQTDLHKTLHKILTSMYPEVVTTTRYSYAIGEIPICLVAHMDTVFTYPPLDIFYDKEAGAIWSPQGLGADDRAGVFAIIKILSKGFRPHIVFTTDEEKGCIGADILSRIPCPFPDCRFIIELDRANKNDCVFYDCTNDEFEEFIENYGFETHLGTFSDICSLCPSWGIAGVNLSIGYVDEHSISEVLFVPHMLRTINKVEKILKDYNKDKTPYFKYESIWGRGFRCFDCGKQYPSFMTIPTVADKKGNMIYLCGDCAVKQDVKWCAKCGTAVLPNAISENELCPMCEEEENDGYDGKYFRDHRSNRSQSKFYSDYDDYDLFGD